MREASNEKDLKRFLSNAVLQLDVIQRGYHTFRDAQLDLIKRYPEMVGDELSRYRDSVRRFFSLDSLEPLTSTKLEAAGENPKPTAVDPDPSIDEILEKAESSDSSWEQKFLDRLQTQLYLKSNFIQAQLFDDIKNS